MSENRVVNNRLEARLLFLQNKKSIKIAKDASFIQKKASFLLRNGQFNDGQFVKGEFSNILSWSRIDIIGVIHAEPFYDVVAGLELSTAGLQKAADDIKIYVFWS